MTIPQKSREEVLVRNVFLKEMLILLKDLKKHANVFISTREMPLP